jgi:hypothetical protein
MKTKNFLISSLSVTGQNSVMAAWHCHATQQSCCDTRQERREKSKIGLEEKKEKEKENGKKRKKRGRIQSEDGK